MASAAFLLALTLVYQRGMGQPSWTRWIVYPVLLFCAACILCKRLHDRGRAGWWAGIILLALATTWQPPPPSWHADVLLIAFVDLGLWPGQRGGNRFGADRARSA